MTSPLPSRAPRHIAPVIMLLGLLLVAANLRAPITSVAPILASLQTAFQLSPTQAGMLTTLPLLAFGTISPFASRLVRKYGLEYTVFGALLLLALAIALRAAGSVTLLYLGTLLAGVGIAVGNVLLPSLVKRDFPGNVPTVTGLCAVAMGAAAALTSALAVPAGSAFGWQSALAMTIVLPVAAALLWSGQLSRNSRLAHRTAAPDRQRDNVWRSALAWQVTLFMGLNSLLYYALVGWLPSILTDAGFSPAAAGSMHGIMQLASALPGLLLGPVIHRMQDQRLLAAGMGMLMGTALAGFSYVPGWASLWAFAFGLGSGGGLLLALIFMGLRAGSVHQAASLSGMAQCVGYLLAAGGPTLAGKLHDITNSWHAPLVSGIALAIAMAFFGSLAGRSRTISTMAPEAIAKPRASKQGGPDCATAPENR